MTTLEMVVKSYERNKNGMFVLFVEPDVPVNPKVLAIQVKSQKEFPKGTKVFITRAKHAVIITDLEGKVLREIIQ